MNFFFFINPSFKIASTVQMKKKILISIKTINMMSRDICCQYTIKVQNCHLFFKIFFSFIIIYDWIRRCWVGANLAKGTLLFITWNPSSIISICTHRAFHKNYTKLHKEKNVFIRDRGIWPLCRVWTVKMNSTKNVVL